MTDHPLVTMSMITYNQEKYVKEAVRGMFSQTYEPLEIVISDDCSTDGTWAVILEEVSAYRTAGGRHKNIVLNRNEKNLGIILHRQAQESRMHGELLVENAGDDISMPNRVEQIVKAWVNEGCKATVICHAWQTIDLSGKIICAKNGPWRIENVLGAATAYSLAALRKFPLIVIKDAFEDHVSTVRALCFGKSLMMDEPLVKYRIGAGVTSGSTYRVNRLRIATGSLMSVVQSRIDVAAVKENIANDRLVEVNKYLEWEVADYTPEQMVCGGMSLVERFRGLLAMRRRGGWRCFRRIFWGKYFLFALSPMIGDWLVTFLTVLTGFARNLKRRSMGLRRHVTTL